jgi:hypothetical protein
MEDAQESQAQEMIYIGVASLQSAVHEEQAVLCGWGFSSIFSAMLFPETKSRASHAQMPRGHKNKTFGNARVTTYDL